MTAASEFVFDSYLATEGPGRKLVSVKPRGSIFAQGTSSSDIFFLQTGRAKLAVVSESGKEATIALLSAGEFIGEEAIGTAHVRRFASATAITQCSLLKLERKEMIRVLRDEPAFSERFLKFLLVRGMRTQADLVDQLFNSSEKRLARTLLLMTGAETHGQNETLIPEITQESLAEMIGTTRSRVSFFMNRFRRMGMISYNGRIQVNKPLLTVFLHDQLPGFGADKPLPQRSAPAVDTDKLTDS